MSRLVLPVYSFDPACTYGDRYPAGAMIHEGIHCILPACPAAKNCLLVQEGGTPGCRRP